MFPARAQTLAAKSGEECTNFEAITSSGGRGRRGTKTKTDINRIINYVEIRATQNSEVRQQY